MVLKFRIISDEQDGFIRDFEILDKQSFFHFHLAIQDNLHFDKSQIASFYLCDKNWEKEQEVTLFELTDEENPCALVMDSAVLGDHVSEIHDKLYYVFDVFNERLFFIELVDTKNIDPTKEYPLCTLEEGAPPQQILMDRIFNTDKEAGIDLAYSTDFLGEEIADLDDLEELGFLTPDEDFPDE